MADYTDIDKLREQAKLATLSKLNGYNWKAQQIVIEAAPSLLAELVGLRTEVDQLRTENERLREFIMAERKACSFDGPLPTGSWPDVALQLIRQLLGRRDALQAEVEQANKDFEAAWRKALDAQAEVRALQTRIDAVAALHKPLRNVDGEAVECTCGDDAKCPTLTLLAAAVPVLDDALRAERDALQTVVKKLLSALGRTEDNFRLAIAGKPVRDMAETLAENDAARLVAALGVDPQKEPQQ